MQTIYIRRDLRGVAYATPYDLSKYTMVPVVTTLKVRVTSGQDPLKAPTVTATLDKLNKDTVRDLM